MSSDAHYYPSPGELVEAKYRIDRVLGEGGMGAVVAATHLLRRAPVALKFISPAMMSSPEAIDRFFNEAVAASQVKSEHVVKIFDVGRLDNGSPFLVMELLEGEDLDALITREGKVGFSVGRSVHFVLQVLRGLQTAHEAKVIHRDLKPSNVFLVTHEGEPNFVKILDFGVSKVIATGAEPGARLTTTSITLGTPLYTSPEQARDARMATERSDIYSVFTILYELLTGRTPFLADTHNELLYFLFTVDPEPVGRLRPDVPAGLEALIQCGLSKDPADRPATAQECADLLAPYADARSSLVLDRLRGAPSHPRSSVGKTRVRGEAPAIEAEGAKGGARPVVAESRASTRPGTSDEAGANARPEATSATHRPSHDPIEDGSEGTASRGRARGSRVAATLVLTSAAVVGVAAAAARYPWKASEPTASGLVLAPTGVPSASGAKGVVGAAGGASGLVAPTGARVVVEPMLEAPVVSPTVPAAPGPSASAPVRRGPRSFRAPAFDEEDPKPKGCDPPFVIGGDGERYLKPGCG